MECLENYEEKATPFKNTFDPVTLFLLCGFYNNLYLYIFEILKFHAANNI